MGQPMVLTPDSNVLARSSLRSLMVQRYAQNIPGMIGLVGLTILTLIVTFGPMLIDRDLAMRPQPLQILKPPSDAHILGTDEVGRDILARLVFAGRVSLTISFPAMLVSVILGTVIGISAGYFGGLVDQILMRLMDAILSLPSIFVLLIVGAVVRLSTHLYY